MYILLAPTYYLLQARARVNNQTVVETNELVNEKEKELNRLQKSLEKAQSDRVSTQLLKFPLCVYIVSYV